VAALRETAPISDKILNAVLHQLSMILLFDEPPFPFFEA